MKWKVPIEHKNGSLSVLHNKAYILGGWHKNKCQYLNTVNVYDCETVQQSTGVPMNAKRCDFGTAVLHDKIYAVNIYV